MPQAIWPCDYLSGTPITHIPRLLPSVRLLMGTKQISLSTPPSTMEVDGPKHLIKSDSSWLRVNMNDAEKLLIMHDRNQFHVTFQYFGHITCLWLMKLMVSSHLNSWTATGFKQCGAPGADAKLRFLLDLLGSIVGRVPHLTALGAQGRVKSLPPAPCPLGLRTDLSLPRGQAEHSPGQWTEPKATQRA